MAMEGNNSYHLIDISYPVSVGPLNQYWYSEETRWQRINYNKFSGIQPWQLKLSWQMKWCDVSTSDILPTMITMRYSLCPVSPERGVGVGVCWHRRMAAQGPGEAPPPPPHLRPPAQSPRSRRHSGKISIHRGKIFERLDLDRASE